MNSLYFPALSEVIVIVLGYGVLGVTGFGSALVIIPLLAWQKPVNEVVPLVLLLDVFASITMSGLNFKAVRWKMLPALIPGVLAGAVGGVLVLKYFRPDWLLVALGLYVIWVGARGVMQKAQEAVVSNGVHDSRWAFMMGLVETVFGTAGPLALAWLTRHRCDPATMRATLPAVIIGLAALAILLAFLTGTADHTEVIFQFISLAPFALLAVWAGHTASRFIAVTTLKVMIYVLLVLSGVSLAVRGLVLMFA